MEKITGGQAWKLVVNLLDIEQRKEQNNYLIYHQYLGMVKSLICRLNYPSQIEFDDLVQVGIIVLLNCIDKFDPTRNIKFVTYAQRSVYNRLINYINRWRISFSIPPCDWKQFTGKIKVNKKYYISGKDFERKSFSIDNLTYIQKDMLGKSYDPYSQMELNLFLDKLGPRERLILLQKDILGGTCKEISNYHKITQQRVNQIYWASIMRLRKMYNLTNNLPTSKSILIKAPLQRGGLV